MKAKTAERRRAARAENTKQKKVLIDFPIDETPSEPDGLDTIFESSSYRTVAELNNSSINMNDFPDHALPFLLYSVRMYYTTGSGILQCTIFYK